MHYKVPSNIPTRELKKVVSMACTLGFPNGAVINVKTLSNAEKREH